MRNTISFLSIIFISALVIFSACKKDDDATPPDNPSFEGSFTSSAHTTSGTASINQEETVLTLTNFKTDSGPDLNIYLATSISNVTSNFIDLGNIKGVDGDYTYDLPDNVDYLQYKYVVIWCVDFNVNFGYSELIKK